MTDKYELARQLVTTTDMSIDLIMSKLDITHEQYREYYPDTPISPGLALDIIDARDVDGLTIAQIQRKWSLSNSQLYYALYNNNATKTKVDPNALPRTRVIAALKASNGKRTQTEIAEDNGVSQSFVHKIAKELKLLPKRKKRVVLTQAQREAILKATKKGISIESLAKQYGVTRDTLYKQIRGCK